VRQEHSTPLLAALEASLREECYRFSRSVSVDQLSQNRGLSKWHCSRSTEPVKKFRQQVVSDENKLPTYRDCNCDLMIFSRIRNIYSQKAPTYLTALAETNLLGNVAHAFICEGQYLTIPNNPLPPIK
jgi:hypothetical protein